jgi:hypothetical protein
MPKTRSTQTVIRAMAWLTCMTFFLIVWVGIGIAILLVSQRAGSLLTADGAPTVLTDFAPVLPIPILCCNIIGGIFILFFFIIRPLWGLYAAFFLPPIQLPATLLEINQGERSTSVLFESRGKRIRLSLGADQLHWMLNHAAPGDTGLLSYRANFIHEWQTHPANAAQAPHIQIFLSYSRAWKEDADYLRQFFESKGMRVWKDDKRLEIGNNLTREITSAIDAATYFVPLLSPEYWSSEWCVSEFEHATMRGIMILPIKVSAGMLSVPPHLAGR